MKKKSLIERTIFLSVIQCILLLAVFVMYLMISYRTAADSLEKNMHNLMQIYGKELEGKIDNADMLLERLIYKNTDYDMLQSPEENDRYYASVKVKDFIEEQTAYDYYIDAVVVAESEYGACLDYENTAIKLADKEALRQFTKDGAKKGRAKAEWTVAQIGSKNYIYKMNVWQGKAVGIFMAVDHFMENASKSDFEKISLLLTDSDTRIWAEFGNKMEQVNIGEEWKETTSGRMRGTCYQLAGGKLNVYAYISLSEIVGQIRLNMILMMLVIIILAAFSVLVINYLRREMIVPMSHMQKSMELMGAEDYSLRITEEYRNKEFTLLKDTFNHLMDEIVNLKIESYEKQIDLQETELKCVKLQIRPHFFLNAMTTISSLSQQGRNLEIQQYITALSKNIRYMFRSGLHTVTLGEEIRHVENYFEMQELKYPNCVFYFSDVPKELEEWRIPQMLIHTIIENEYKYAVSVDHMLTILIKASMTTFDNEEMLMLEIEDDGEGYPEEFMEEFAKDTSTVTTSGERVGLHSIKRMMELMYERKGLFLVSNIIPHGCKNTFYIPKYAVHELTGNHSVE